MKPQAPLALAVSVAIVLATSPMMGFAPSTPKVIAAKELRYPPMARMARIQGTVTLRVLLSDDGFVKSAEVIETTVNTRPEQGKFLSDSALENVREWRFEPVHPKHPTLRDFEMRYVFKLVGQPSHGYRSRMKVHHSLTIEVTSHPPVPGG